MNENVIGWQCGSSDPEKNNPNLSLVLVSFEGIKHGKLIVGPRSIVPVDVPSRR